MRIDRYPSVSVGVHAGPVVERDGDVFGSTVNLAARAAAYAAPRQLLCTEAVAQRLDDTGRASLRALGTVDFANVPEPVALYELAHLAPRPRVVDPVCRMQLDPRDAAGWVRQGDWHFCSLECLQALSRRPRPLSVSRMRYRDQTGHRWGGRRAAGRRISSSTRSSSTVAPNKPSQPSVSSSRTSVPASTGPVSAVSISTAISPSPRARPASTARLRSRSTTATSVASENSRTRVVSPPCSTSVAMRSRCRGARRTSGPSCAHSRCTNSPIESGEVRSRSSAPPSSATRSMRG
jgi:YHS domain-containing protein